jgi:GNAT superfamily N-acetyltransferase
VAVRVVAERVHGPARRAIRKGLYAFNDASVGHGTIKPLTLTVRDRGRIVGGLAAESYYGWMFVSLLWIDDKHRGTGVGTTLMTQAEAAARERGLGHVWLDTFSFQAPGFYEKMGYRRFAQLKDFPAGGSRLWFTKKL